MNPVPADPWRSGGWGAANAGDPWPEQPDHLAGPARPGPATSKPMMSGRAPVPAVPAQTEPTAELPAVLAAVPVPPVRPVRPTKPISWRRASRASLRSLADGWGFTATGVIVAISGWGVWAAAGRGRLTAPFVGIALTLVVAGLLFALTRLLGYLVVEQLLGRPRLHARWSHLLAGLLLCFAGFAYLSQTIWIVDAIDWIRQQWQRIPWDS